MKTTFVSQYRKFKLWFGDDKIAFEPYGRFSTDDERKIEALRNHPLFGRKFVEASMKPPKNENIIQGIRSAGTQPVFDKDAKLVRLGELRAKLLRKDGSFRKDASDEEKKELKEIREELGV